MNERKMKIGNREFEFGTGRIYLMGILNVTPDSFSDGGLYDTPEKALRQAVRMVEEGADILDLGAESTRPGYLPVTVEEETERLCRTIERIRAELDIPLSIDSCKPAVMDAALSCGGDMGNDIWGLRYEELHPEYRGESMAEVLARHGKPAVIMHNDLFGREETARTGEMIRQSRVSEEGKEKVWVRVREGLDRSLLIAKEAGIDRGKLILDPGIGFAKSTGESLAVLNRLSWLRRQEELWLLAASRKSVIGDALGLPVNEREEGTIVTSTLAFEAGFSFVRVHDVEKNKRALEMLRIVRNS